MKKSSIAFIVIYFFNSIQAFRIAVITVALYAATPLQFL